MPYFMRGVLWLPRGPHSAKNLARILEPRSGERILEVGPGIGTHAVPMASAVLSRGILDVLDIQGEMLRALMKRARKQQVMNIVAIQGNAETLPYPDGFFDAAYMIDTLGEIPDGAAALRELGRVLKPTGRLVIGEIMIDPDFIPLTALKEKARHAGFVFERMTGSRIAYFALFRRRLPGGAV
jgi:ubiquinone/menaquinone biosynthesis C-methylase UbiE